MPKCDLWLVESDGDVMDIFDEFSLQALSDLCQKVSRAYQIRQGQARAGSGVSAGQGGVAGSQEKPFDDMNNIVANLLLNLTRWAV